MRTLEWMKFSPYAALTAALMVCASPANAGGAGRFVGSVQPYSGRDCGAPALVNIVVSGGQLTYMSSSGSTFRGAVLQDGSFRILPVPQTVVERRMPAVPVLEGRVSGDRMVGQVASRWCAYRVVAQSV